MTTGRTDPSGALHAPLVPPRRKTWNLETFFLGLLGLVMILLRDLIHHASVVQETIVLVVFLGGLMGITRIPFPSRFAGRPIPLWAYPVICGFISSFMDSFLVLLLVGTARLEGPASDQFRFRAYNMLAALIGGLMLYFGEVYMLPLALKYGMREWHSMLPVVPPVLGFLAVLAALAAPLRLKVVGITTLEGATLSPRKTRTDGLNYVEFAVAVLVLLWTRNALLCLGALFLYAWATGQGDDLIEVMKTETEVSVMLLLVIAAFVETTVAPFMSNFAGWWAFIPAIANGVLTGAIYPATGEIWHETVVLSTAVLLTPVSSLVGVMLFKRAAEWRAYVKLSLPLAAIWFLLAAGWFYGPWQWGLSDRFYSVFSKPALAGASVSGSGE